MLGRIEGKWKQSPSSASRNKSRSDQKNAKRRSENMQSASTVRPVPGENLKRAKLRRYGWIVLAPSSNARSAPSSFLLLVAMPGFLVAMPLLLVASWNS